MSNDVGVAATVTKEESEELKKIQYQYELDLTEMADRKTINVANLVSIANRIKLPDLYFVSFAERLYTR